MIENALQQFSEGEEYGNVLRAKGMVPCEDGTWIYYDLVDGDGKVAVLYYDIGN